MFGEDPKQLQSDEFFGLFSAFLVSFAVSHSLLALSIYAGTNIPILHFVSWRQRGRGVRAPDLKSGGRRFKSRSGH